MLKENADNLKKLYVENKAYALFFKYLNENIDIKNQFSDEELNAIFPEPVFFAEEKYVDSDEDEDDRDNSNKNGSD